jgi:DNA-binding MarR family transcriptional regulator
MLADYTPRTVWIKHPYDGASLEHLPNKDRVLHFIINCGPCCYSHIVSRTGIRKSLVSPALRKLEAESLVTVDVRQAAYQNRRLKFYSGVK